MACPPSLPENVTPIKRGDTFSFSCHKNVSCFTDCCRMLELILTPYDTLRLRQATGRHSQDLLDTYIIEEQEPGEPFPRFYLTMVDDGRASCVFVNPEDGCTIYSHRPSACRTYPLGRAVMRISEEDFEEHFVVMKEKHCHGFSEPDKQDVQAYIRSQDLQIYNTFNDRFAKILQHERIRQGFIPSKEQIEIFTFALYNIDSFKDQIETNKIDLGPLSSQKDKIDTDEALLSLGLSWITSQLF